MPLERAPIVKVGWEKVKEVIVEENTTDVVFDGLDLDAAKVYKLFAMFVNPLAVYCSYGMFFNDDYTDANYRRQYIMGDGATLSSGRISNPHINGCSAGYFNCTELSIMRVQGKSPKVITGWTYYDAATLRAVFQTIQWLTAANVTKITIRAYETNGIGVGSKFILFKVG